MEIIIICSGGIVQSVRANGQDIKVEVLDLDTFAAEAANDAVAMAIKTAPHRIY